MCVTRDVCVRIVRVACIVRVVRVVYAVHVVRVVQVPQPLRLSETMACIWSIVSDGSEVQLNGNC